MAHPTRSVANVNVNGGQPNANVYKFSNDNIWNANYEHHVFTPKLRCFSFVYGGGVFFCCLFSRPFFHPPNILPTSSSWAESVEYLSSFKHLFSHAICRKNFTPSSLEIAIMSRDILVSGGR